MMVFNFLWDIWSTFPCSEWSEPSASYPGTKLGCYLLFQGLQSQGLWQQFELFTESCIFSGIMWGVDAHQLLLHCHCFPRDWCNRVMIYWIFSLPKNLADFNNQFSQLSNFTSITYSSLRCWLTMWDKNKLEIIVTIGPWKPLDFTILDTWPTAVGA